MSRSALLASVCGYSLVALLGLGCSTDSGSRSGKRANATAPPPEDSASVCVKPGDVCQLAANFQIIRGTNYLPTATSIEAFAEFNKLIAASDSEGIAQLVESGQLLATRIGDEVRVLDFAPGKRPSENRTEVRMASGEYQGRKVYVHSNFVARPPAKSTPK